MTILVEFNFVENEKRCFISDVRVAVCGVFYLVIPTKVGISSAFDVTRRGPGLRRDDNNKNAGRLPRTLPTNARRGRDGLTTIYFLTFRKKRYRMRGHVRVYVRPIGENDKLS